jgi:hypothetical protein
MALSALLLSTTRAIVSRGQPTNSWDPICSRDQHSSQEKRPWDRSGPWENGSWDHYGSWDRSRSWEKGPVAKASPRWLALGGIEVCEICIKTRRYLYLRTAIV